MKLTVLIANRGARIPIWVKYPHVILQSQANGRFTVISQVDESTAQLDIWQLSSTSTLAANLNGDAYGDLILLAPGYDHRGLTLYGAAGNKLIIGNYIDETLIGTQAFNQFDSLIARDSNGNGTDDLMFYQDGTTIAIAYAAGNSFSVVAQPENASPLSLTSRWSSLPDTNKDLFSPTPPNAAGISVTRINKFEVTERPAIISNLSGASWTTEGEVQHGAAKTIVIVTDSVNINQPIQILGSKADLVFITESPKGDFTCNACSFEGLFRLSIITQGSNTNINTNTTELGHFTAGTGTQIHITDLKAPGAIGLEILTDNINTNASADLIQRVSVIGDNDSNSSDSNPIVNNEDGDKTLAAGSINILLGNIQWAYQDNEIKAFNISANNSTNGNLKYLDGKFRAKTIRISASSHLEVKADASTFTDFTSGVSYRGEIFLPEESIDYQALGGDLTIGGLVNSEGEVRYKAKDKLTLETNYNTRQGNLIKAVSGSDFILPYGKKLVGNDISIGAQRVINSGSIQAANQLEIAAIDTILNQYGGELFGASVKLDAGSIIRNGSRTPYVHTPDYEVLMNASSDLLRKTFGLETEIGAYYRLPLLAHGSTSQAPTSHRSHIVGAEISIKAKVTVHSPPHYFIIKWQVEVTTEQDYFSFVQ